MYLYRRVVQAKLFIDSNYMEQIDLDNIAEEASFSKFHFIRLFKSIYGKTPHQYLTHRRIEKAKDLLKEGLPVTDVCFSVGFESIGSFSSLFRKQVGMSPSAYALQQQQLKDRVREAPLHYIPGCFAEAKGWK